MKDWLIHYPVWDLGFFGGGFLIAVVATLHVYISHFAVGGGFFLVMTERKGHRENSPETIAFVRRHSRFFLLATMVFGAISGVGIWFTMSLLNPTATSKIIHTFLFAFATEWVFFVAEITALFIYCYSFDRLSPRRHMTIGWLYALFAFLSLFAINGIVSFMLTPGAWLSTRQFWQGIFNPTFWPALFFRFFIALMLAGLFGFATAVFADKSGKQDALVRYCARWTLVPLVLLVAAAIWYLVMLPLPRRELILKHSPEILPFVKTFMVGGVLIFMGGVVMAIRQSGAMRRAVTVILLLVGLGFMGSFEWIREAARRPYIVHGLIYSNSVMADDFDSIASTGILPVSRWSPAKSITPENRLAVGRYLFTAMCAACHSIGGPMNDILPLTRKYGTAGMVAMLDGMGKVNAYMPRFPGNPAEKNVLAEYIVNELHRTPATSSAVGEPAPKAFSLPPFSMEQSEYVLLAWNSRGVVAVSDCDDRFSLAAPGNDLFAQLIRRGETPEIVFEDVVLTYTIESGMTRPSRQVAFWDHAASLTGRALKRDMGLTNNGLRGQMTLNEELRAYVAAGIPAVPYSDDGAFHPYPLVTVTAIARDSETILAQTKCVAPVSTELGCRNCHGGDWRRNGITGIAATTADDILTVHDRINRTRLKALAESKAPRSCGECHHTAAAAPVRPPANRLSLSAAVHGFHANYLPDRDAEACSLCHPTSAVGSTRGFRGLHNDLGLTCTGCHGSLEDHAASLLVAEMNAGKPSAARLLQHIKPKAVADINEVKPRKPWINQPDCLLCHVDFSIPETDSAPFNQWGTQAADLFRMRADDAGIMCAACHGSPHAIYPATNIFGNDRDNIQPVQYQRAPYPIGANNACRVCHTVDMTDSIHHPNMRGAFRNTR